MTGFADARRIEALIEGIDRFNATPGRGTTRLTYSPEYRAARDFVAGQMVEAGLEVREDAVGNIFGRLEGARPDLAPILVGSHLDSVPNGGRFDGPAGVVAGIETAFLFRDLGLQPDRPIEVVALIEEEGTRFGGGLFGSRLLTGQVDPAALDNLRDDAGVSAAQAMTDYGLDPVRAGRRRCRPDRCMPFWNCISNRARCWRPKARTSPSSTASWGWRNCASPCAGRRAMPAPRRWTSAAMR